ncbi:Restriction endonuclease [compost metagenome]
MPWPRRNPAATAVAGTSIGRSARQIEAESFAPQARAWTPEVFDHIEWRRFEALCEALYGQAGVRTESQSHGADGGVDIWLYLQNASKPMIVQCKHWSRKVAVDDVRAFFGVLKSHDLERGIFATSATFTSDASSFASAHGISAQDREGLLKLIATRTPAQQALLLETAYQGEYWRPTCASCGIKMVVREPKGGGALFWGCTNFAKLRCRSKIQLRAAER